MKQQNYAKAELPSLDLPLDLPEVLERFGRRGELHYQAAEDGVDPHAMIEWADTEKDS